MISTYSFPLLDGRDKTPHEILRHVLVLEEKEKRKTMKHCGLFTYL